MPWKPKTVKKLSPGFVSWKSLVKQWSLWEKHIVLESQVLGILSHAECHPFGASIWTPQQDGSFTYQFSSLSCQPPKKNRQYSHDFSHLLGPHVGFFFVTWKDHQNLSSNPGQNHEGCHRSLPEGSIQLTQGTDRKEWTPTQWIFLSQKLRTNKKGKEWSSIHPMSSP